MPLKPNQKVRASYLKEQAIVGRICGQENDYGSLSLEYGWIL